MLKLGDKLHNGALVLDSKPYSKHPNDKHLLTVICCFKEQFVTWILNTNTGGAAHGHYHGRNFKKAALDFIDRVYKPLF